nr:alpha/beta hydrolase fold domain-containing protein [Lentilactobacillus otakiensis]
MTIEPIANPTSQILYFHGGAFTVPMNEDQLEMITRIATESASRIQVADFPLLPGHSADEILTFSQSALELVTDSELRTFIVADSAGAKIALQLLVNNPGKIAGTSLISPCWICSSRILRLLLVPTMIFYLTCRLCRKLVAGLMRAPLLNSGLISLMPVS